MWLSPSSHHLASPRLILKATPQTDATLGAQREARDPKTVPTGSGAVEEAAGGWTLEVGPPTSLKPTYLPIQWT